jgi:hypothetical protein
MYEKTKTGKEIDFVSPDFTGCVEGEYVDRGWKVEARTARATTTAECWRRDACTT